MDLQRLARQREAIVAENGPSYNLGFLRAAVRGVSKGGPVPDQHQNFFCSEIKSIKLKKLTL